MAEYLDKTGLSAALTKVKAKLDAKQDTLTTAQTNAVNSGITASKVTTYDGYSTSKQDTLKSGLNIKTINGDSLLGSGNITIEGGGSFDEYAKLTGATFTGNVEVKDSSLSKSATVGATSFTVGDSEDSQTMTATNYQDGKITNVKNGISSTLSLPSSGGTIATTSYVTAQLSTYATKTDLNDKQDKLESGTNIKTINGNSLLGEGDIEISGGSTSDMVTKSTAQKITGAKTFTGTQTFTGALKVDEIDNTSGNAMVRYKSTESNTPIVLGSSEKPTVLMGNGDRPKYSKSGSDFVGNDLALKSDVDAKQDKISPNVEFRITFSLDKNTVVNYVILDSAETFIHEYPSTICLQKIFEQLSSNATDLYNVYGFSVLKESTQKPAYSSAEAMETYFMLIYDKLIEATASYDEILDIVNPVFEDISQASKSIMEKALETNSEESRWSWLLIMLDNFRFPVSALDIDNATFTNILQASVPISGLVFSEPQEDAPHTGAMIFGVDIDEDETTLTPTLYVKELAKNTDTLTSAPCTISLRLIY